MLAEDRAHVDRRGASVIRCRLRLQPRSIQYTESGMLCVRQSSIPWPSASSRFAAAVKSCRSSGLSSLLGLLAERGDQVAELFAQRIGDDARLADAAVALRAARPSQRPTLSKKSPASSRHSQTSFWASRSL